MYFTSLLIPDHQLENLFSNQEIEVYKPEEFCLLIRHMKCKESLKQ